MAPLVQAFVARTAAHACFEQGTAGHGEIIRHVPKILVLTSDLAGEMLPVAASKMQVQRSRCVAQAVCEREPMQSASKRRRRGGDRELAGAAGQALSGHEMYVGEHRATLPEDALAPRSILARVTRRLHVVLGIQRRLEASLDVFKAIETVLMPAHVHGNHWVRSSRSCWLARLPAAVDPGNKQSALRALCMTAGCDGRGRQSRRHLLC